MKRTPRIMLKTGRLKLIPLELNQLIQYRALDDALEKELEINIMKRTITEELKNTIEQYLIPYLHVNPSHLLFATIWVIIHREENVFVGDIGFNAAPSEKGVIEVGYSTYEGFENNGFMTEALSAMCQWAFGHDKVKSIIAQTAKDNFASQRVLTNNAFEIFADVPDYYWWRLDNENYSILGRFTGGTILFR